MIYHIEKNNPTTTNKTALLSIADHSSELPMSIIPFWFVHFNLFNFTNKDLIIQTPAGIESLISQANNYSMNINDDQSKYNQQLYLIFPALSPGGVLPSKKGYRDVQRYKTHPLRHSTRPPFQHFQFHKTLQPKKNTRFPNFPFKMPNFDKFLILYPKFFYKIQFRKPQFVPKISSEHSKFDQKKKKKKNQFNKPQNLVPIHSTRPHFRSFRSLIPTQTKVKSLPWMFNPSSASQICCPEGILFNP